MPFTFSKRNTDYTWEKEIPLRSHTENGQITEVAKDQESFVFVCAGLASHSCNLKDWFCWWWWWRYSSPFPGYDVLSNDQCLWSLLCLNISMCHWRQATLYSVWALCQQKLKQAPDYIRSLQVLYTGCFAEKPWGKVIIRISQDWTG